MAAASENLLSEMVSPPSAVNPSAAHTPGSAASHNGPPPPSALRKSASKYASPNYKNLPRTSRLRFNKEVLVAEYVPKKSGISPKSTHRNESLDEMVARAEQRAIEEMGNAYDDDDNDDDDDPFGGGGDDAVAAFHDLLRGLYAGGSRGARLLYQQRGKKNGGGAKDAEARLMELIAQEEELQGNGKR